MHGENDFAVHWCSWTAFSANMSCYTNIMQSCLSYIKTFGMHKISYTVGRCVRVCVCVCVCVWVRGWVDTSAFIAGCPFSHILATATVMGWPGKWRLSVS
jgi:hypothetical protein